VSAGELEGRAPGRRTLHLVSLNHLVNDGSVYLLTSLFPVVVAIFGFSVLQLGVVVGVGYLVSVIFQPIVGHYSEGRHPRDMLAVGIAIVGAAVFSFVFASGFYSVLLSVVVLRLGSSFYHPVGASAVSAEYEGPRLDGAMGFQSAFGNLGILIVFLASAPIYLALGWKAVFVCFGLLALVDIALTLALFGPRRRVEAKAAAPKPESRSLLGAPAFFLVTMFLSGGAYAVMLNFANVFLQGSGAGVVEADTMVAAWVASAFVGAILVGRLTARVERGVLLSVAYFVSAATALLFVTAHHDASLEVAALAVNGFALSATYPITYSALADHIGRRSLEAGRSFGVIFSAQTVGGAALGLLAGYISGFLGLGDAFLTVSGLTFVGGVLALSWSMARTREAEKKPLPFLTRKAG
jgi:MFS transporter, FSR family, fosmidomycin resistance protein